MSGIGSILGLLVFLPFITRSGHHCNPPWREAFNNARQIGIVLFEYESEFGKYPASSPSAKTSNDVFRQLFVSCISPDEKMFYAEIPGVHRPDGLVVGPQLLEKGECGFTYFGGAVATDNPTRPLVVTPMIPGTDRFDRKALDGKALILRIDCSVQSLEIDKSGHVLIAGRNMMDPHHLIWDGHPPVIAWPDL